MKKRGRNHSQWGNIGRGLRVIEEFAWVLSDRVAVRSASSKSIQSRYDDERAGVHEPTHDFEDEEDEEEKGEEQKPNRDQSPCSSPKGKPSNDSMKMRH